MTKQQIRNELVDAFHNCVAMSAIKDVTVRTESLVEIHCDDAVVGCVFVVWTDGNALFRFKLSLCANKHWGLDLMELVSNDSPALEKEFSRFRL